MLCLFANEFQACIFNLTSSLRANLVSPTTYTTYPLGYYVSWLRLSYDILILVNIPRPTKSAHYSKGLFVPLLNVASLLTKEL